MSFIHLGNHYYPIIRGTPLPLPGPRREHPCSLKDQFSELFLEYRRRSQWNGQVLRGRLRASVRLSPLSHIAWDCPSLVRDPNRPIACLLFAASPLRPTRSSDSGPLFITSVQDIATGCWVYQHLQLPVGLRGSLPSVRLLV